MHNSIGYLGESKTKSTNGLNNFVPFSLLLFFITISLSLSLSFFLFLSFSPSLVPFKTLYLSNLHLYPSFLAYFLIQLSLSCSFYHSLFCLSLFTFVVSLFFVPFSFSLLVPSICLSVLYRTLSVSLSFFPLSSCPLYISVFSSSLSLSHILPSPFSVFSLPIHSALLTIHQTQCMHTTWPVNGKSLASCTQRYINTRLCKHAFHAHLYVQHPLILAG